MPERIFSPKDFLKERRPERYSDSVTIESYSLDRTLLEHHLATLNKRSQELAFETFVKSICEKTICPNLLEQTGPVAGGDGKVDTQTFPVSEQNRNLWYEGINESSHKERWAFAISTQEEWKPKCRKDIRKIKHTARGYVKAFFITNQYAKANQRSAIEDELTKETGIDTRILDISWLLDQTFKSNHIDIAIETLSIIGVKSNLISQGSNDYKREKKFEEINNRIRKEVNPSAISVQQVDLFLDSAILSKECEKDIMETQGLFDRALRISNKFGTRQQKFNSYYQYAWASHWWFEDFNLFESHLESAFQCIKESSNATRWQDLVTLLIVHHGHIKLSNSTASIDIEPILSFTINALKKISSDETRPSNSLLAKTSLSTLGLVKVNSLEGSRPFFTEILTIVKEGSCLVGYPFESIFYQISELEFVFGEFEEYELLLDFLTDHSSSRYSEIQSAMKSLRRGAKKLEGGKPYQAIILIGKSLVGLYKNESKDNIIIALNIISHAYSDVGLHWASRGSLLLASLLVTDVFWQNDELSEAQVKSYIRLTWKELMLGRICHALSWLKLALIIDANLEQSVLSESEAINMDGFVAHIILRTDFNDYKYLERLPDALEEVGLFNSRAVLLYCLGYEEFVSQEYSIDIDQEYTDFLLLARDYDFKIITPVINTFQGKWNKIRSSVLGCEITISFPKRSPFVEMAESILSAIEGFCSTGIIDSVATIESHLIIDIIGDDDDIVNISHEIDSSGTQLQVDVTCSAFTSDLLSVSGQKIIQEWMYHFIIEIYCHIIVPQNIEDKIESLLMNEKAIERSVPFTSSFMTQYDILGKTAIDDIASLLDNDKYKRFNLKRLIKWDSESPREVKKENQIFDSQFKKGETPENLLDNEKLTHSDIKTFSLIKPRLWDKASWGGTGFLELEDGLPVLALLFENEHNGKAVFSSLLSTIGTNDSSNRLRVSIIQNISNAEPFNYKVMLCENPSIGESKMFTMISRINMMTPSSDVNLKRFLTRYQKTGIFALSYGTNTGAEMRVPTDIRSNSILLTNLILKDAHDITPTDIEYIAMSKK